MEHLFAGEGRARLKDVSLQVRAGEIVGIAGVDGNGQEALVEVVVGRASCRRKGGFGCKEKRRPSGIFGARGTDGVCAGGSACGSDGAAAERAAECDVEGISRGTIFHHGMAAYGAVAG